ncbi:MAG TPA: HNH endonuclease signature motif containing protein, partial [Actinomycetota bacterium]|nr:HNH endonuclease signature motif containing protein [Actinomycetota bacterium]
PDVAQRLQCDGRLKFVLTQEDGNALGIGYTSRNIPASLMRELRHRDHGCTFPGCGRRFFLQGHHIIHWPKGPTDLGNLVLVCYFHHKLVHELFWTVRLDGSKVTWFRPSGERFEPGPDPPDELPLDSQPPLMVYEQQDVPALATR